MDKTELQGWLRKFPPTAPVVVIPVFNAYDDALECVESILAHTRVGTPIAIFDDASTDKRILDILPPMVESRGLAYVRHPMNLGFVENVNRAFDWCAPCDVVIVNSDVIVPPEWLERLQAAAYYRSTIATATPFTNYGTIVSIPYRNRPTDTLIGNLTITEVDARVRAASLKLRPVIPTAVGHCTYFKRVALDAIGYFDPAFSPGYGEEVDFSQRAVTVGFIHVAADDLFVFHKGSSSFGSLAPRTRQRIQEAHEQLIARRYSWYHSWKDQVEADVKSPLAFAIERARGALVGYRIAIDATIVDGQTTTGTQVLTLELIRALARSPMRLGHLAVIVQDGLPKDALLGVDQLVDQVLPVSELGRIEQPFDLIHRPFQVRSASDITLLQRSATRFIVSQLDCIAYSNPSYAPNSKAWADYRALTETVFAVADGITFISEDAAQDVSHQGLHIPDERKCIIYPGVDHHLHSAVAAPLAGREIPEPFLLMIGTNFKHKNRVFALRLLKELIQNYQWNGFLVLAGPTASVGGSETEEAFELERNPEIRLRVCYLGSVSESEKQWLFENAALVLYPSHYEGFGLVPFEAATAGRPVLTTRTTSLSEILGDQVTYLDTLDPVMGAKIVWSLVNDSARARAQVDAINFRKEMYTWGKSAVTAWDFYSHILDMPARGRGVLSTLDTAEPQTRANSLWNLVAAGWRVWRKDGIRVLASKAKRRFLMH